MFFENKIHIKKLVIFFFIYITGCQLEDPLKPHGIIYLENRSNKLELKKTNKNDVISIFGRPHIKNDEQNETWIYMERVLTKGKFHKLGQHVLLNNNVLVLNFDKYGVLNNKRLIKKDDMKKLKFSSKTTENSLTQKSFIENFLQSIKQKMYRK